MFPTILARCKTTALVDYLKKINVPLLNLTDYYPKHHFSKESNLRFPH